MLFKAISFFFSPFWNIIDPYLNSLVDLFSAQKAQRITIKSIFIFVAVATLVKMGLKNVYMLFYVMINSQDKLIHSMIDFTENGLYSDFLSADQAYDISIDLDVPESDRNIDLGNFMINLELKSKDNNTIQSSGRPCILTYKSKLLRITSTIWKLIPLVLGFVKEDQKLKVVMFENFIENGDSPMTHAYLTIPDKNPEVYNANIQLDAHFRGLRYSFQYSQQEIDNDKWLGVQHNGKMKTLRNHPDEDEEQVENGGSEFVSNNDESSNISDDDDSITSHSESMNPENTDYDESGFETTGEGNNYNTTTDNSDVETPRRRLSRLSSNNDEEDNDD
ncbi:9786_t:CDS:10 [Entrophospora sp. SA101]|nr:9786_t:CDS:10 [Entrophospora sp. SA101]